MKNILWENLYKFFNKNKAFITRYTILLSTQSPLEIFLFSYLCAIFYNNLSKNTGNTKWIGFVCCVLFAIVYFNRLIKKNYEKSLVPKLMSYFRINLYQNTINNLKINPREIHSGDILTSLISISTSLNNIVFNLFTLILPRYLSSIFIILFLLFMNPKVGLITLVYFILITSLVIYFYQRCSPICRKKIKKYENVNAKIEESIKNANTIITNSNVDNELKKIKTHENGLFNAFKESLGCSYDINKIFTIIIVSFFSVLYYYIINYQKKIKAFTKISSLIFISYLIAFSTFVYDEIPLLINDYRMLENMTKFYNTIIGGGSKKVLFNNNLEIKNLNYKIKNNQVFTSLNFKIKRGEKVIIKGKSGSGKSTLTKIIMGFYVNDYKGKYIIDNTDINKIKIDHFRKGISYCEQHPKLFDDSVINNIKYGLKIDDGDVINFINTNKINNLQQVLKIKKIGYNGFKLSGGQKQMINICRCFLNQKNLVILDEPTSSLDDYHSSIVKKLILKSNRTFIIISHDNRLDKISHFKYYNIENKQIKLQRQ